jgi:hypothetical protein
MERGPTSISISLLTELKKLFAFLASSALRSLRFVLLHKKLTAKYAKTKDAKLQRIIRTLSTSRSERLPRAHIYKYLSPDGAEKTLRVLHFALFAVRSSS